MNYVLYHANCMDGFAAAYAAWKWLHDNATYIPVNYGEPLPVMPNAENIFILDFSYPRAILLELSDKVKSLTVLDHHKTAQEDLKDLAFAGFNMSKSGAVLAWEYFHQDDPVPALFAYIQDRDLWQWKLPNSKEVNAYLSICPKEFQAFDFLMESSLDSLIEYGRIVLKVEEQYIERCMKNVHLKMYELPPIPGIFTFAPRYKQIWSVNSPILQSEIGHEIAKIYGYGDVYYYVNNKLIRHSLRSIGDIDVSSIAKSFGGGGHKNAAMFEEHL